MTINKLDTEVNDITGHLSKQIDAIKHELESELGKYSWLRNTGTNMICLFICCSLMLYNTTQPYTTNTNIAVVIATIATLSLYNREVYVGKELFRRELSIYEAIKAKKIDIERVGEHITLKVNGQYTTFYEKEGVEILTKRLSEVQKLYPPNTS